MITRPFGFRAGHGPLDGVTVLDLSGYVAGPYGAALLGDQDLRRYRFAPMSLFLGESQAEGALRTARRIFRALAG